MAEKNNSIQTIERDIVSYTNDRVTMTQTFGYKGIIWIVLGVLIFFTQFLDKENGAWTMAALILGMSLGVYGLIVFLARKPQYVYEGKKSMKIREFMFDGNRYNDVEKTLRGGRFQRNVGHSSQCCKQNDAENPLRNRLQHCVFSVVQIFFRDLQF